MRARNPLIGKVVIATLLSFFVLGCSKDDPGTTPNPNPSSGSGQNPNPNPNPSPIVQNDISQVDNAMVDFLQKYNVPGAALAVSVNEKMVYNKGYGESNTESSTDMKADDVFRIASISKVFTATAILKLVEDGQLSLDDKVFGADGVLGNNFGTATFTQNHLDITVDHLLLHELGGWGTSSGGDPIDYQPDFDPSQFIEYTINNWPLVNSPGQAFSYSNTGYWLLARIIETISGQSYEDYLKNMLSPIGITSFKTTTFRESDREPNEVQYYGTTEEAQYIYTIASRRDGDGGVVISAPDLLRFMCAIDGASNRSDVVDSSTQGLMTQASSLSNLGRGLAVWEQQDLWYFTGSLPGTRSWMIISGNGRSAVILLNYRRADLPQFDADLQSLLLNIVKDNAISWQTDLDQF